MTAVAQPQSVWPIFYLAFVATTSLVLAPAAAQEPPSATQQIMRTGGEQVSAANYETPVQQVDKYFDAIGRVEAEYGPYAPELSDLYLGLGQSLLDREDYLQARDAFHRGVMVLRVNFGPNSPEQTRSLYLIANIETVLGKWAAAEAILNNIHFISASYYGEHNPELLPVLKQMYDWHVTTRPLGSALADYEHYDKVAELARELAELNEAVKGRGHPDTTAAYRRLGEAQLQMVRYLTVMQERSPSALTSESMDSPNSTVVPVAGRARYGDGLRAFRQYVDAVLADDTSTPLDHARALTELGDWYLVFGRSRVARQQYERAYGVLSRGVGNVELADRYLGQPKPMHFLDVRMSPSAAEPEHFAMSVVEVSMTVTDFGDVRYVEVVSAPEGLSKEDLAEIEKHVRDTPFRPAMRDGDVVTTKDFIWRYPIAHRPATS